MRHYYFSRRKRAFLLLPVLLILLFTPSVRRVSFPLHAAGSTSVRISQVYGGGGNNGAPYLNDFIELFNASSSAVDLSGWSVQYAAATSTNWQATALNGLTIQAYGYLLVVFKMPDDFLGVGTRS